MNKMYEWSDEFQKKMEKIAKEASKNSKYYVLMPKKDRPENIPMNQPNQPPKSAEEVLEVIECHSPQFARYVTDEEIDAMWPITQGYEDENRAAKAMRDLIFNNVKQKP